MYHARNAVSACNHTLEMHELKGASWHPMCIKGVSAMFRLVGEGLGLGRMNEITLNGAVGTHILVVAS
jgi:hypothetical protein